MSGDKKGKEKPNLGIEFFYKLSIKPEFKKDLIRARRQLCIPGQGFSNDKNRMWWINNNRSKIVELTGIELQLKTKYGIPMPFIELVDDYLFFGKPSNHFKHKAPPVVLHPTKELEKFYREFDEPYTTMLIYGNATKTQVIDFIKKNWKEIEIESNKGKRTRKIIHKDRNDIIHELWKLSVKELQREAKSDSTSKSILIPRILVRRGITDKELSDGYIRKIASQK